MKEVLDSEYSTKGEYLTRKWIMQLVPRPHRANAPCGRQVSGDYKIWLLSFTSAHNNLGAWLSKDFRYQSSDF